MYPFHVKTTKATYKSSTLQRLLFAFNPNAQNVVRIEGNIKEFSLTLMVKIDK